MIQFSTGFLNRILICYSIGDCASPGNGLANHGIIDVAYAS